MPTGTTRTSVALIAFCCSVGREDGAAGMSELSRVEAMADDLIACPPGANQPNGLAVARIVL